VKWLRSITVIDSRFQGYQQATAYHYRASTEEAGVPVERIRPRALMVPPGVPDFMSRIRFVEPGEHVIEGRAWSGLAPIVNVEFSADGGASWQPAELEQAASRFAWRGWTFHWDATTPGEHDLCARATDSAGNTQPAGQDWNAEGVQNNGVQRVRVVVGAPVDRQVPADSLA